jgi:hypothetical protein
MPYTEAAGFSNSSVPDPSPIDMWAPHHPQLGGTRPREINSLTGQPLRAGLIVCALPRCVHAAAYAAGG